MRKFIKLIVYIFILVILISCEVPNDKTDTDIKTANELAKIADVNIQEYGLEMLKAGTDLTSYTEKQLLNLDAKKVEKME